MALPFPNVCKLQTEQSKIYKLLLRHRNAESLPPGNRDSHPSIWHAPWGDPQLTVRIGRKLRNTNYTVPKCNKQDQYTVFESFRSLKWHDQVCLDKFLQDFLPSCSFLKINTFGTLYDQMYPNVLSCKQTTNGFNIPQSQGKLRSGSLGQNWTISKTGRREDVVKTWGYEASPKCVASSRLHSEINFVQFVAVGIWRWEAFPGCASNVIQEHRKPW